MSAFFWLKRTNSAFKVSLLVVFFFFMNKVCLDSKEMGDKIPHLHFGYSHKHLIRFILSFKSYFLFHLKNFTLRLLTFSA